MEASFAVQDVPVVAEVCDPERRLDWEEPWADGIASPPRRKKSDSARQTTEVAHVKPRTVRLSLHNTHRPLGNAQTLDPASTLARKAHPPSSVHQQERYICATHWETHTHTHTHTHTQTHTNTHMRKRIPERGACPA